MFSIKKEEIFLLIMGLIFFASFLFFYGKKIDFTLFVAKEAEAFSASIAWFVGLIVAFIIYFIVKILLAGPRIVLTGKSDFLNLLSVKNPKTGEEFSFWGFTRTIILILFIFSLFMFALAGVNTATKGRLLNQEFFVIEKNIFGELPFLWLHSQNNFLAPLLRILAPAIIWCFQSLSLVMGVSMFVFYIVFSKEDFYKYIFAIFISCMIALPFWYFFPINSPNNYYLSTNPEIADYNPPKSVLELQRQIYNEQKENPPVSTFPSMHTTWAIFIVYYLYRNYKKTIWLTAPWLLLLILGTTYLAQHYFVDILLAIPLSAISIIIANKIEDIIKEKTL